MPVVQLACQAMATRFELVLHGDDPVHLRAAGEEALAEITRLEAHLSFYRPTSDLSRINRQAAHTPVVVEPWLFALLDRARQLYEATDGAFDPTVGPLMRCWGFVHHTGHLPEAAALAAARACTGMHHVVLDAATHTVAFRQPGVQLDLGSIGKGYAVDEAVRLLQDLGITDALLHGGTSTVYALGKPPEAEAWQVALPMPGADETPLAVLSLRDEALSVSAVWGKAFVAGGKTYGHVLDPRRGHPVDGAVMAAVVAPSATDTDALSTALLVLGPEAATRDGVSSLRAAVVFPPDAEGRLDAWTHRLPLLPSNLLRILAPTP
jgi:thiamine biosynthesis lipoprotein